MTIAQSNDLDPTIFRSYDIRGIVDETLREQDVMNIGKAIGTLTQTHHAKEIVIARDGRISSPRLTKILIEGILSTGCDVLDLGMVPTPLLYYSLHALQKNAGVMVTGSHNPAEYNGLKIVMDGKALTEAQIKSLYDCIIANYFVSGEGRYSETDITASYLQAFTENIKLQKPLRVVIDAGNGVAGMIAPQLFQALGCEVETLYCEVDGCFPHHHPDPSQIENLQDLIARVTEIDADIGLAFDGDADRLGVVTRAGDVICADRLLMLFAQTILLTAPKAKIIYDVKCTHHLAHLIQHLNGEAIMWKTGHSLIKAKMAETEAQLAGEMSGHFFFKDRWFGFDDALYAGARLLEILAQKEYDSDVLFATIPNSVSTPELKIPVNEVEKFSLMCKLIENANFADADEILTIDGLRVNFADSWGLIRPSNTTPYLILRFEAVNNIHLEKIKKLFRDWILGVQADLVLPF